MGPCCHTNCIKFLRNPEICEFLNVPNSVAGACVDVVVKICCTLLFYSSESPRYLPLTFLKSPLVTLVPPRPFQHSSSIHIATMAKASPLGQVEKYFCVDTKTCEVIVQL